MFRNLTFFGSIFFFSASSKLVGFKDEELDGSTLNQLQSLSGMDPQNLNTRRGGRKEKTSPEKLKQHQELMIRKIKSFEQKEGLDQINKIHELKLRMEAQRLKKISSRSLHWKKRKIEKKKLKELKKADQEEKNIQKKQLQDFEKELGQADLVQDEKERYSLKEKIIDNHGHKMLDLKLHQDQTEEKINQVEKRGILKAESKQREEQQMINKSLNLKLNRLKNPEVETIHLSAAQLSI